MAALMTAAVFAALASAPGALAQARGGDPVLETARAECESAARASAPPATRLWARAILSCALRACRPPTAPPP